MCSVVLFSIQWAHVCCCLSGLNEDSLQQLLILGVFKQPPAESFALPGGLIREDWDVCAKAGIQIPLQLKRGKTLKLIGSRTLKSRGWKRQQPLLSGFNSPIISKSG